MASISSPGVGSGLDISSLIDQLVAAERQPATQRLDLEEARTQSEVSALGTLKGALSDFSSSLTTLKTLSTYATRKASSADTTVFSASADNSAVAGRYAIDVVTLADAHKLRSSGFTDAATAVGSGTLTIAVGAASFAVTIAAGSDSLAEVRDAINAATDNKGVAATLVTVDDGAGGSESRLVLTATASGTANALTVTASDDDGNDTDNAGLSRLVYDPAGSGATNLTQITPATDALFKVDGMAVTRASNTVGDAIDGVTLTLTGSGTGIDLTVATDDNAVRSAINNFVTGYNTLASTIGTLSKYDATTGDSGTLLGDATLLAVQRAVTSGLAASVSTASGKISHLTELGITTQADGTLKIDDTKLGTALAAGLDGVGEFFAGSGGLATALDAVVSPYLASTGIIATRTDILGDQIDDIADRRLTLDRRMTSFEDRLLVQFTAMDTLVSQLNATSSFLTQQFAALNGLGNSK